MQTYYTGVIVWLLRLTVLCYFGKLPAPVKLKLINAYCSNFYGCELWDLSSVCVTCRKGIVTSVGLAMRYTM